MIDVYISAFPFPIKDGEIFPATRKTQIENCKNQKAKDEKFYVWKLLETAFFRSFGVNLKDVVLYQAGEKWTSDLYKFSLSHSQGIVAVALSRVDVGIDVEKIDLVRFRLLPDKKCLTAIEQEQVKEKSDEERASFKNALWTVKEADFKRRNGKVFRAETIETESVHYKIMRVTAKTGEFFLSVVGEKVEQINVFTQDGLSVRNVN